MRHVLLIDAASRDEHDLGERPPKIRELADAAEPFGREELDGRRAEFHGPLDLRRRGNAWDRGNAVVLTRVEDGRAGSRADDELGADLDNLSDLLRVQHGPRADADPSGLADEDVR